MEDHRGGPRMGSYQSESNLGVSLRLVYMEQSGLSLAVLFPGKGLPRIVHWGDPVADPQALLGSYDALVPVAGPNLQCRNSGAVRPNRFCTQID